MNLLSLFIDISNQSHLSPFAGRKSLEDSAPQHSNSAIVSINGSPQRVPNKRSSITVNMPAAGLGQRPPSIISTASQDEGGFNEAMPEVKAKLQPATYEDDVGAGDGGLAKEEPEQPHSLNYVDVGYRLNPDGSESREVYGSEAELYDTAKVSDMQRKFHGANGFVQESSTVYAIIKPEQQQQQEALQQAMVPPARGLLQSPTSSVDGSPLHRGVYNSPPVGVVSPIRRRSSEQNGGGGGGSGTGSAKTTPPMSPARTALVKGIAPIASIDAHEEEEEDEELFRVEQNLEEDEQLAVEYVEEEEEEQAPVLPERRPPVAGAIELQDLEYADTSAGEDEEDILQHLKCGELDVELMDDVVDEVIRVHVNAVATPAQVTPASVAPPVAAAAAAAPTPAPAAAMPRDDSLPDAMTAAEAERLLSSR